MSIELASLAIEIDSRDPERAVGVLDRLTRAGSAAEAQTERLAASNRILAAETRNTAGASRLAAQAISSIGLAAAAGGLGRLADSYTTYTNQLKIAGLEGSSLARTQDALFASAQRTGAPIEALGTLYGRTASAAKDLGATQKELLQFSDAVATSLKVGGKSATESSGALLQLSQALGGSKIQAEEYNSLIDGLRPLLIAVASGTDKWGGSVSKLTQDVKAGKVSTSEFFDSALRGKSVLDDLASKSVPTLSQAFTKFNNSLTVYVGQANQAASVTTTLGQSIGFAADHLDEIAVGITLAAAFVGVRWAAAGAQFVATEAARVSALGASIAAERAAAVSSAQAASVRAAAQAAELTATNATIVSARQSALTRIAAANSTIAANAGVIASTYQVQLAERTRAAAMADLVALGRLQTATNTQIAATSQAAAVAQTELAAATRLTTASMAGLRGAGAGVMALFGGPWGLAIAGAALVIYGLSKAISSVNEPSRQVTGATTALTTATKGYEQAAFAASTASGEARVSALKEAAAKKELAVQARNAAAAQLTQAKATLALIEAEQNRRVNPSRNPFMVDAEGADAALAATGIREAKARANIKSAKAAIDEAAKSISSSDAILKAGAAAVSPVVAGLDKKTKQSRDATADFIKGLRQEVDEIGLTEKQLRGLEIARAISDAPSVRQKLIIKQLGQEREQALAAAAAWETLNGLIAANDDRTLTPLQKTEREGRTARGDVSDFEAGAISAVGEATRLATENAEAWVKALSLVPKEIKTTEEAMQAIPNFRVLNVEQDLDALQILQQQATQAADNIAAAFGKTGEAIGASLKVFSNYRTTAAALNVEYSKSSKTQADADRQALGLSSARVRGYGDMTAAAKTYFREGSTGYKVLQTAEIAFRTVEALNTLQAMALDSAHTATSVTNAGTRAGADGIAAYAKTLASLPFPFNLAAGATVIAALASVGVAIAGGGGGGGAKPGSTDLEDRQKAQGTGSVLGDATAQSASISRALEVASANQNRDLEYSNQMVRSLRSIDANIGSLTAAVARSLSVDSFLNGSSATTGSGFNRNAVGDGLSNIPLIGSFLGSLFGTKSKTTLQDTGINFADQSIADILSGGVDAQAYQQTLTTKKKKFFGITTGGSSTVNTDYSDLDAGLNADFTRVISSLRDGVLSAAGIIGVDGAQATLDAFQLSLGTISLKDLKGDELEAALSAVFGKAADQMSAAVLPSVAKFQEVGEGAFETIARLARDYQVVDTTLKSIGKTFALVGVDSLEARERLIELAGGLDALQDATSFFAENFLSDAERLAPVQKAVTDELKRLGLESLKTRDQFKQTVLGIDVTTAAGADLYASLLALAPAFAKVTEESEKLAQAAIETADSRIDAAKSTITKVKSDLNEAYSRQSSVLKSTIDAMSSVAKSLQDQDTKLAGQAIVSPTVTTDAARAAFAAAASTVRANPGDKDAYGKLQTAGDALVSASKVSSTSALEYNRDIADVRRELQAAGVTAQGQADTAERQLSALTDLVDSAAGTNETLKTVAQLLVDLNAAQQELVAALADRSKLDPTPTAGNDNSFDAAKYLANNPDLKANWDAGGSLRGAGATLEEAAKAHYDTTGKFEIQAGLRKFATGGSFTVGGSGGTDSKLVQFMATPGEMVDVRTPGQQAGGGSANAELAAEIRALRSEVSALRAERNAQGAEGNRYLRSLENLTQKVTEGGSAMKTRDQAA